VTTTMSSRVTEPRQPNTHVTSLFKRNLAETSTGVLTEAIAKVRCLAQKGECMEAAKEVPQE